MDIHPWTKYEIARMRDEERLLRARSALRAVEIREARRAEAQAAKSAKPTRVSFLDRLRRRGAQHAATGSEAV